MKTKILVILFGAVMLAVGCVSTVNEHSAPGVPFIKDKIVGRYQRSVDQCFTAAKEVVSSLGTLLNESTLYNQTNAVKTVGGKVNQRSVWIRIESVDPKITQVTVQTRTYAGGADLDLAAEIDKQIALKLVTK